MKNANAVYLAPTENQGLKDLVEVLDFGFQLSDKLAEAKANDGKISISDFPLVLGLFAPAEKAYEGINNIGPAWQDATDEERGAVLDYFKDAFDLPNDRVERKIEKFIVGAVAIYEAAVA